MKTRTHTMAAASWERLIAEVGNIEGIQQTGLLVTYTGRGTGRACYRLAEAYLDAVAKLDGSARYAETTRVAVTYDAADDGIVAEAVSRYLNRQEA